MLAEALRTAGQNRSRKYCKHEDPNWFVRVFPEASSKEELVAEGEVLWFRT